MDASLITAVSAAIVAIIGSVTAAVIALRTKDTVKKVAVTNDQKLDGIHTLVDGRLTKALTEIASLRSYITKNNGHTAEEVKNLASKISAIKPIERKKH